jgi:hypothetical protein
LDSNYVKMIGLVCVRHAGYRTTTFGGKPNSYSIRFGLRLTEVVMVKGEGKESTGTPGRSEFMIIRVTGCRVP